MRPDKLLRFVGVKYEQPWNCWDFVRVGYAFNGVRLPRRASEARKMFKTVIDPEPWDIAFFVPGKLKERHIGIMLNKREFVHCSKATNGVAKSELNNYRHMFRSFLRLRCD